eukprot:12404864-Karenia_brevis.AAC.1
MEDGDKMRQFADLGEGDANKLRVATHPLQAPRPPTRIGVCHCCSDTAKNRIVGNVWQKLEKDMH